MPRAPWLVIVVVMLLNGTACSCDPPPGEGEGEGEGPDGEGEGEGPAGEGEGEPACGGVSAQGACTSATEGELCAPLPTGGAQLIRFDCEVTREDAVCFSLSDDHGVDCGVPLDSPCFDDVDGALPCAVQGAACVISSPGAGACAEDHGPCFASEQGSCEEDLYLDVCFGAAGDGSGQARLLDCAALGAACVDGAGCNIAPGTACTPVLTVCGDSECPFAAVCPAGGEGEGEGEGE